MNHTLVTVDDRSYIEVSAPGASLATEQDALELIALSWQHGTGRVLLHREVFSDAFFELRSGSAGTILQKFVNYDLKVAALIPAEALQQERFQEMAWESSRGRTFAVFGDLQSAVTWLLA